MDEVAEKLHSEVSSLAAGFDLLTDHVVITDSTGAVLYANKSALEKTGFSAEEVQGMNPGKLWGGQMPKDFYETMWKTIHEDKKPFVGQVKNRKKDGSEYWAELRVYPVLDEHGAVKLFIGIEPDITDVKKQTEASELTKQKLYKFMVERELVMKELKAKVATLLQK
jgi:PAS domain S-box-containing protein